MRRLPGTLVVRVTERAPVALVAAPGGLRVYDGSATLLPIDPSTIDVDLPILSSVDSTTLRLLDGLKSSVPAVFAEVSRVRRSPGGDLVLDMSEVRILASADADVGRFAAIPMVLADLKRRRVKAREIDLRFRGQIVARTS